MKFPRTYLLKEVADLIAAEFVGNPDFPVLGMNEIHVVEPGDIVFGDIDGVCVIPQEAEVEVIQLALEKANGEKLVQKAIQNGMSACEAFAKFGIM